MKLASDLREFVELLNSEQIEYLVVGGHAVGWHGYPRYTGDIDVFVGLGHRSGHPAMAHRAEKSQRTARRISLHV